MNVKEKNGRSFERCGIYYHEYLQLKLYIYICDCFILFFIDRMITGNR